MKYTSDMTQFRDDIAAALRTMIGSDSKTIKAKFKPNDGSPAPLRDYLRDRHGKSHHGCGSRELYINCDPKGVTVKSEFISENTDDCSVVLSWSQTAKFIRDNWDEVLTEDNTKISVLEALVNSFDETKVTCPNWKKGSALKYLKSVNGVHFECESTSAEFYSKKKLANFLETFCEHHENCPNCGKSDFECDGCKYDVNYCCNYPGTPDDYCVCGDKRIPKENEKTEETTMAKFNINAMIAAPAAVMPEQYTQAAQLHAEIINCAKTAQENLYQMAMGFKKMRDEKLYIALGYDNFGDYCEQKAELSRQNVYQYIKVVENLPKDFVLSTRQIGKEKMYLLSTISEAEREEIVETTDLESTTVKELKAKIKELEGKKTEADKAEEASRKQLAQREEEINRLKGENIKLQGKAQKAEEIKAEKERLQQLLREAEKRAREQPEVQSDPKDKEIIASLEAQIKELESRPIDVAFEKDDEEINRLKEKIAELEKELEAETKNEKAESGIKVFAVKLTMDRYQELIEVIESSGNAVLKEAVMSAQILRV